MRLLKTKSLRFITFPDSEIPPYAILSHTWGNEEVTFQDIELQRDYKQKTGWSKIVGFARKARNDRYKYIWVDTCCIDKSSSAELSEAINSMYRWYRDAAHCYVYLDDVQDVNMAYEDKALEKLQRCRWFTRGWTLQELLAPSKVIFCDSNWNIFGWIDGFESTNLVDHLAHITGIPADCIKDINIAMRQSVSFKMSWAAKRQTSRIEDEAYCLLGLFGVNMPLLYGEGRRAFRRLQEEILKESEDHTLLTWRYHHLGPQRRDWEDLASQPADFADYAACTPQVWQRMQQVARTNQLFAPWSMTSRGLRVELPCIPLPQFRDIAYFVLFVCCSESHRMAVLPLRKEDNMYFRTWCPTLLEVPTAYLRAVSLKKMAVFISRTGPFRFIKPQNVTLLYWQVLKDEGYELHERHPLKKFNWNLYSANIINFETPAAGFWTFAKPGSSTIILVCVVEDNKSIWRLFEAPRPDYGLFDLLMSLGGKTTISVEDLQNTGRESFAIDEYKTLKIVPTKLGSGRDMQLRLQDKQDKSPTH